MLYTIFAYLAIFRLDELGFPSFKEFIASQDPTKMFIFISYLFNPDILWSSLRAEWMKVTDLKYLEDEIIAGIEQFMPDVEEYSGELQARALGVTASQQSKKEAASSMSVAMPHAVNKKPNTRPISPNLTKPRPPLLPEPQRINQKVIIGISIFALTYLMQYAVIGDG